MNGERFKEEEKKEKKKKKFKTLRNKTVKDEINCSQFLWQAVVRGSEGAIGNQCL